MDDAQQRHLHVSETPLVSMAKINLPSHIVRGLFFALRRVSGVRRGPIRHYGHHAQRRSVLERLGPRVRRNAGNGGHGFFGRLFDSAARGIRACCFSPSLEPNSPCPSGFSARTSSAKPATVPSLRRGWRWPKQRGVTSG